MSQTLSTRIDWVEVIEPRSKELMFVNLVSGECCWDEPVGVSVKRIHEQDGHQWWELYDVKTSRFYYYNASTQQTCWQKPTYDSSIIIPLAKLQILKQNTNSVSAKETREVSTQTRSSCMVLVNNSTQTTPPPTLRRGMCYANNDNDSWNTKRSLRSYLINEARFAKGLDGLNDQEVLLMSDYDDFWDSGEEDDDESTSDQWDADDEVDGDEEDDEDDDEEDDERESEDAAEYDAVREEPRNASNLDQNHRNSFLDTSSFVYLKQTPSPGAHKSASFSGSLPKKEERLVKPSPPLSPAGSNTSHERKPEPPPHQLRQPVPPQRGLSLNYDVQSSPRVTPRSSPQATKPYSPSSNVDEKPRIERENKEKPIKERRKKSTSEQPDQTGLEQGPQQQQVKRKEKVDKPKNNQEHKGTEIMEKYARENVARHIKRGVGNQLLKRKTSLKQMLTWSKNSIKQPMIATLISGNNSNRSDLKTEAIHCFKLIQQYMGDRVIDRKEVRVKENIAFELISVACQRQDMRDEIFVQLCRQTTDNPRKGSILAGFELMAVCLSYFPPSVKFSPYLASFLANSPLRESAVDKEDIEALALIDHCYHRLVKVRGIHLTEGGSVGGGGGSIYCRKPVTSKEIEMVNEAIERSFPGIFGESLDALMKLQERRWSHKKLPWILTTLAEAILKTGGVQTEGIFRIAADSDELSFIKLVIDCINFDLLESDGDILVLLNHSQEEPIDVHVFSCLLKQWFRSLAEPLIPYHLYETCLEAASSPREATAIVTERLPKLNKLVLGYLMRFLQVFSAPDNVSYTKMDDSNLSMVWAPNILRSSQSNVSPFILPSYSKTLAKK
ncbi:Rho GTPase-activating protein 39 [Halotydeus destructor]|nr:Rho GTPase-activating protein 39 [Halotydeus destructor]